MNEFENYCNTFDKIYPWLKHKESKMKKLNLITLKELTEREPKIFPSDRVRYLVRKKHKNGLADHLYKISNVYYIDTLGLDEWVKSKNMRANK